MQRVASFGAGLFADRPTPETTSANADWTGVMYWTTDTQQVFRWNGSAWVDITAVLPISGTFSNRIFSSGASITAPADTNLNTIYSSGSALPAGILGTTGAFKVKFAVSMPIASSAISIYLMYGPDIIAGAVINGGSGFYYVTFNVVNYFSGSQRQITLTTIEAQAPTAPTVDNAVIANVDTSVAQILTVKIQKVAGADVVSLKGGYAQYGL